MELWMTNAALLFFIVTTVVFLVLYVLKLNDVTSKSSSSKTRVNPTVSLVNADFTGRYNPAQGMIKTASFAGFTALNPFEIIDRVYFINMDHRKDRYYNIIQELSRMGVPSSKIQRIPGVQERFGALGCSKAHVNALLDCQRNGYKNCIVLEDDFMFKYNRELTWEQFNRLFALHIEWDVVALASFTQKWTTTTFDFLVRVLDGQTTGGYMVNGSFVSTLLANFQEGVQKLEAIAIDNPSEREIYCIDQFWKSLQPTSKWYTFHPVLGHQRDSVSDIQGTFTEYLDKKELFDKYPQFDFLISVQNCQARLGKNPDRIKDLQTICSTHPTVCYYQYVGDPKLSTDFSINERDHIVTLRCKDDYLNLCHKYGQWLHTLRNIIGLNKSFSSLKGVFCTDDDVVLTVPRLYSFLTENQEEAYWGHVVYHDGSTRHMKDKAKQSETIRNQLEPFPGLLKYDIQVTEGNYCVGGGYYLRVDMLIKVSDSDDLFAPFPETQEELDKYLLTENGLTFYSDRVCIIEDLNIGAAVARLGIVAKDMDITQIANWSDS